MHQPLATTSHPDLASNSTALGVHWRILTLCALSAVMTALYVYGRPYILYNDGDPLTYFRKAWWFIRHAGGMDVPSRGPSYPIWLILTGAAPFNSSIAHWRHNERSTHTWSAGRYAPLSSP